MAHSTHWLHTARGWEYLNEEYNKKKKSVAEIARDLDTYRNRVRRALLHHGFDIRTQSETQKLLLEQGKVPHPMEGKSHTPEAKVAISQARAEYWASLTESQRKEVADKARENWNALSDEEKQNLQRLAVEASHKAAREGSRLERFLLTELEILGHPVEFHSERLVEDGTLQVDLYLPKSRLAIECDGPNHRLPVWGEEELERTKDSDERKNGLLLMAGISVVRLYVEKDFSQHIGRECTRRILECLENEKPTLHVFEVN